MKLDLVKGNVQNLRLRPDKKHVFGADTLENVSAVSSIIFATAGMSGAAVQTASNNDLSEKVDIYSFEIDGIKYSGCTIQATFKNDDLVEVAYEKTREGNLVIGLKRPSTRSIWTYPYMNTGTKATKRSLIEMWAIVSGGASLFLIVLMAFAELISDYKNMNFNEWAVVSLAVITISFFVFGLAFWFIGLPQFMRSAYGAEALFTALGFADPANVDLEKTSRLHRKNNDCGDTMEALIERWY